MRILSLLTFILFSNTIFSQTIVSTNVENKNVILEEFTGIHCGYCPQGHVIAQGIMNSNPNDVFLINIHTGGYSTPSGSEPDFRTEFGGAIASQSGLVGYPAGTVNRHLFAGMSQGSGTAMSRGDWETASNQILAQQSYVNVGVEASINLTTREITVHAEAYYTGDSPKNSNLLNVAILQDSTYGYQSSGGSNYNHMHRLVHMVTGRWGEEISTTINGSFIDKTYSYYLPTIYNNAIVDLKHIKVVAFVAETQQEIISGFGAYPTYTGSITQNDASIVEISTPDEICENEITPVIKLINTGQANMTFAQFGYRINDEPFQTYNWTGNLAFSESIDVILDPISFTLLPENTIDVIVANPNGVLDENDANNSISSNFSEAYNCTNRVRLEINPSGSFGLPWTLKDNSGTTIYSGTASGSDMVNEIFELTVGECYTFDLTSTFSNGIPGDGYCKIIDSDNSEIFSVLGNEFTDNVYTLFKATTVASINSNKKNEIKIYPNPSNSIITIESSFLMSLIKITDISGKVVLSKNINNLSKININTTMLKDGIYFVNIRSNNRIISQKISIINK